MRLIRIGEYRSRDDEFGNVHDVKHKGTDMIGWLRLIPRQQHWSHCQTLSLNLWGMPDLNKS